MTSAPAAGRARGMPRCTHRQPEPSGLYRIVQAHLATFRARTSDEVNAGRPAFVRRAFEADLRGGILAHGLVPGRGDTGGDNRVIAVSCQGRGVCPSGAGRRMSERAAPRVDRVLPHGPVRQWVFTGPGPVRDGLAVEAGLPPEPCGACAGAPSSAGGGAPPARGTEPRLFHNAATLRRCGLPVARRPFVGYPLGTVQLAATPLP